ncbi:MAG: 50S ribosomal protein L13 [Patescibacteria group bacterium]|nr:50S ribosomal protein L13 [Patescibacteria group bacterium]
MTTKTYVTKESDIEREWHLFDAKGEVLGRLSSQIAPLLMGKNKPKYAPYLDLGDYVVVVNAQDLEIKGKKEKKKVYYRHSQYPGHLKQETLGELMERDPTEVIYRAVKRMLPANKLRDKRMSRLKVYAGAEHPHEAQIRSPKS